jgi:hypothetical protein
MLKAAVRQRSSVCCRVAKDLLLYGLRADASILRQPQAVALSVLDQGCWKVPMAFTHDKDLGVPRRTLASAAILSPGVSKQHVQYGANHGLLTTSNLTLVRDHAWVSKSIFTSCIMVAANPSRRPTLVQSSRHSSSDAKKTYRSCNLILKAVIWCQTCSRSRILPSFIKPQRNCGLDPRPTPSI